MDLTYKEFLFGRYRRRGGDTGLGKTLFKSELPINVVTICENLKSKLHVKLNPALSKGLTKSLLLAVSSMHIER